MPSAHIGSSALGFTKVSQRDVLGRTGTIVTGEHSRGGSRTGPRSGFQVHATGVEILVTDSTATEVSDLSGGAFAILSLAEIGLVAS